MMSATEHQLVQCQTVLLRQLAHAVQEMLLRTESGGNYGEIEQALDRLNEADRIVGQGAD